jgi:hypothetical protein
VIQIEPLPCGTGLKRLRGNGEDGEGTKVSDQLIASLNITPANFHGERSYTIAPRKSSSLTRLF